jgi:beta-galactosidase
MKSVIGYYETLLEMGIPTAIHAWEEFDFAQPDYSGQVMILAHQVALPQEATGKLESFVRKGGTLLMDGLTGYYDDHGICQPQTGFALRHLLGGVIQEFKIEGRKVDLVLRNGRQLPGHAWRGYLKPTTGRALAGSGPNVYAIEHTLGNGRAIWMPTLLGLGSRLHGNKPLASFLHDQLGGALNRTPVKLDAHYAGMMLQVLQAGNGYITILINKTGKPAAAGIVLPAHLKLKVLYGNPKAVEGKRLHLKPEETLVVYWHK